MRAAVITECGRPPSLVHRPGPTAGVGGAAVTVTAAPITPLDVLCASGTSYFGAPAVPYVPGVQGVGVLDDGTAVWFPTAAGMRPGDGSMAERVVVPTGDVVPLPDGIDHRLVAALGLSGVAAWRALTWRGELCPGEQVLVLGAGGVVGQAAVQIARLCGARRVIAGARSVRAQDRARALGADAVVALHDGEDVDSLAGRFRDAADGPVDLVLDPLFGVPAAAALRTLGPRGRLVNLGSSAAETAPFDSATLRSGSLRVLGYTNNELTAGERAATIGLIAGHIRAGRLVVEHESVPLTEVAAAWTRQADGTATRRIVLVPGDGSDDGAGHG
ncbi:zinc-binding alcohol dehydrogenase family protein [Plantactinospora solaniradicis]|uniref:Zinc-binding alcohol dehydrogenase family protein n=1 Tax=Plantactinospora solaniradicis TaxID=1723736 RepID=A0ABW1K4G9_9ACTN